MGRRPPPSVKPDALRQQLEWIRDNMGSGSVSFSSIIGLPTTIAGYGITDSITLTSSALPPTGTGTVGLFHIDTAANKLYWGQGSAWYYVSGTLYTPSTTPGAWVFSDATNSGQIVTVGF